MTTMNRSAYEKLIQEDLEWLLKHPHTLERDHIEAILKDSPNRYYPRHDNPKIVDQRITQEGKAPQ